MIEQYRHKIRNANILLMVCMVCHYFILLGVYEWIKSTQVPYAVQVLMTVLPTVGGILFPCFIYEVIFARANKLTLCAVLGKDLATEKPKAVMYFYTVAFAVLTYAVVCYFNFGLRGIIQYFTEKIALKQIAFTGGAAGIIAAIFALAIVPALAGEFLNKGIVSSAYRTTGKSLSFLLPVLLSVVFYTDVQTLLFRLVYGCAAMIVYKRTNSWLISALFMFVALLPDAISGGGVWLPLDYRSTLSTVESLINGLFALGVAFIAGTGWVSLLYFAYKKGDAEISVSKVKPEFTDVISLMLIPFGYFMLYLLSIFVFLTQSV